MVKVELNTQGQQILVRTPEDEENGFSFLEITERVDSLPSNYVESEAFKENVYYLTTHHDVRVGFVCKFVIEEMKRLIDKELLNDTFEIDETKHYLKFKSPVFEIRNKQIDEISLALRDNPTCKLNDLKGWRNEKYAIWIKKDPYVLVERAMSGPLGIITSGAHINGYTIDEETNEIKFWISRRSATKPTWPLMLDNIIAGGLGYPYGPYETAIKESLEEANLERDIVEKYIKSSGVVNYFFYDADFSTDKFNSEKSYIVGEAEYIYDLHLPSTVIPKPNDGEVDSFKLMSLGEIINALQAKEFKPNCALVMVDFLIRFGYINPENEPNFITICNKMHRTFPFPTMFST